MNHSTSTAVIRETDDSAWCLNSPRGDPIATQWSDDESTFAYAIADASNPTRNRQFKGASWEVPNYQWYVVDVNSGTQFRFTLPEPNGFSFSPDGQYAVIHNQMSDLGRGSVSDVYRIDPLEFVCEYSVHTLFYGKGSPPCSNIPLKDGIIWDIKRGVNKRACEYHVAQWGESSSFDNACKEFYDEIRDAIL